MGPKARGPRTYFRRATYELRTACCTSLIGIPPALFWSLIVIHKSQCKFCNPSKIIFSLFDERMPHAKINLPVTCYPCMIHAIRERD